MLMINVKMILKFYTMMEQSFQTNKQTKKAVTGERSQWTEHKHILR